MASGNFGGAIFEGNIENDDLDSAGIYYNREVMEEINEYKESGEEQYINNYAFGDNQFDVTTFPKGLKQQIMKKTGAHTISLQELWGIR